MSTSNQHKGLCVVVVVSDQFLALPVNFVREMVVVPGITKLPHAPEHVRGVINLRGRVIPIVDLRARLGLKTMSAQKAEFIDLMNQREQDHRNWLQELEASIKECRDFKLATDPHKCAFGKWYYSYDFNNSFNRSLNLDSALRKFEDPHAKIHGVATKVLGLAKAGDFEGAFRIIERTRQTTLADLFNSFNEVRGLARETRREIAVILGHGAQNVALTVDAVESAESISIDGEGDIGGLHLGLDDRLVKAIGRRGKDGGLILVLEVGEFFQLAQDMAA